MANSKVVLDITMSLDGFIAGPHDNGKPLHDWLFSGDTPSVHNDFFKLSRKNAKIFDAFIKSTGAIITGRRTYDITGGWGGNHPFPGVPVFVLTSHIPKKVPEGSTPFTFITDGIKSAVSEAIKTAGKKNVYVLGGASVAQQCLKAGLLDEMMIHLVPVLLGGGVPLFTDLKKEINIVQSKVIKAEGVTHLRFAVK